MRFVKSLKNFFSQPIVVGLGNFDGVHRGHQHILNTVLEQSKKNSAIPVCFTFFPHPRLVLSKNQEKAFFISTFKERVRLIESMGIHNMCLFPFDKELSLATPKQFVDNILVNCQALKILVVGFNFRFGFQRKGTPDFLREKLFSQKKDLIICDPFKVEGSVVSSTKIRDMLQKGDLKKVKKFLGRFFSLSGIVCQGQQRGRRIGFPTANIDVQDDCLLALGVYGVRVKIDEESYCGVMNIGTRPTFEKKKKINYEVHLLNFTGNLYKKFLTIDVFEKIREEYSFSSKNQLIDQIKKDCSACQKIFKKSIII